MNMFGDSGSLALPFAVTVTVCAVSALFLLWRHWPRGASAEASEEPARVETFRGPMPEGAAPKDGVFTMETLKKFDGVELPMLVGICGKVVNVSSSENFNPGLGYGKLWAGSDSTYAMAKVSLDASHANKLDWTLDELSESETKTLASWLKHFTHKYPVVGTMREYDSWDFSAVEELAKSQTPFGAPADVAKSKTESATPKTTKAAKASSKKQPAREEEGFKVERGGRYLIKACEDDPSLEGCVGILEDFVGESQCFRLKVGDKSALVRPTDLASAPAA